MDPGHVLAQISPETPRDIRRPYVEAQLIATMARLVRQGVAPTDISVGLLAREAGISRATFYLYFADRQAFNLRLREHFQEVLEPAFEQLWAAISEGGSEAADEATLAFLRTYREHRDVAAALSDVAAMDPVLATHMQAGMESLIDRTALAIEGGKVAGVIRADVPANETAALLVWMAERACSQLARDASDEQLDRLVVALRFLTRVGLIQPGRERR